MKKRTLIFTILFSVALTSWSLADVYLKQKVTQSGMPTMGQEAQQPGAQIHEMWLATSGIRTDMGTQSTILDMKKSLVFLLNHVEKTYTEMPMDVSKAFSEQMASESEEDAAGMQQMMQGMMKMEMTVQPTGEKKKIGPWDCQKYIQTLKMAMGTITTEVWATEDIQIDPAVYQKFTTAMLAQQPGMAGSLNAMMQEQKKIKGIPVLQKAAGQMMGMQFETTTELLEAKETDAPESLFAVPAGYQKKSFMGND